MDQIQFEKGMTVAELKKILADWPEKDEFGTPCEVWLETEDGTSNIVRGLYPLNRRESSDGMSKWADILLTAEG